MDGGAVEASASDAATKLKLFLALSRTQHAVLDLATPALGAVVALGGLPPPATVALGLLTAFAAYTAVYALNDLVDHPIDREKIGHGARSAESAYLDAVGIRHPLAAGLLTPGEGLAWAGGWSLVALAGCWLLNPVCALIFLGGCLLEFVYCRLLRVTWLRVLVSGVVKTLGGVAAAFAVTPNPPALPLAIFFAWIFAWEVGGQNVPADLVDLDEDRKGGARTVPVRFGRRGAAWIVRVALVAATLLGAVVLGRVPGAPLPAIAGAGLLAGAWILLLPAARLGPEAAPAAVTALFNRASVYPLVMLGLALAGSAA